MHEREGSVNSNGGGASRSGKREFYTATVLALSLLTFLLFASPTRAQEQQEPVPEAQKARIERLGDAEAQEQFLRAAQRSNAAGDLTGDTATATPGTMGTPPTRITINERNCTVANNATITFEDVNGNVGVVVNGDGSIISATNDQVVVRGPTPGVPNEPIVFQDGPPDPSTNPFTVLSSSGIDCGDPDEDDGFDDELLFLLLLELLEDDNGDDGDDGDDNGDDDGDDGNDGDGDLEGDLDGDGDVDQEDEALSAENDLNGEGTDGQYDDNLGGEDGGVSASSNEDGAEASTPGASASSGGDPDEQDPVSEPQGDVEDEIPTSGPLPNTGGVPVAAGTVLALVLFGAGLLLVRLVMLWRERRA